MIYVLIELVYVLLALWGAYFIVKKKRVGWLLWLISTPFVMLLMYYKGLYYMILIFIVYALIDIKGLKEWKE